MQEPPDEQSRRAAPAAEVGPVPASPTAARGRALVRAYGFALAAILVIALFPVLSVAAAGIVADAAGCELNEAAAHPCLIGGVDFGEMLYAMGVLGWLMLGSLPVGGVLLMGWAIALLVHLGNGARCAAPARDAERRALRSSARAGGARRIDRRAAAPRPVAARAAGVCRHRPVAPSPRHPPRPAFLASSSMKSMNVDVARV
ncbi:hypothetical protein BBMA_3764 [Burkholderia pseudomallei MSHR1079]|nr:hypothetical protein BBMA_3764 [Burkholderia pseudomallei MSHR1079]